MPQPPPGDVLKNEIRVSCLLCWPGLEERERLPPHDFIKRLKCSSMSLDDEGAPRRHYYITACYLESLYHKRVVALENPSESLSGGQVLLDDSSYGSF